MLYSHFQYYLFLGYFSGLIRFVLLVEPHVVDRIVIFHAIVKLDDLYTGG